MKLPTKHNDAHQEEETMPYTMARATVEDYETFRGVFDGAVEMRKSAGALGSRVFQSADDPNDVII